MKVDGTEATMLWQRQTILYKTQTKFWCEQDIFIPPKQGEGQTA
jgi:hypothetical protein